MDNSKIPINMYLDLSKAFDTLDYNILLSKPNHYSIIGVYNALFRSYLTSKIKNRGNIFSNRIESD